MNIFKYLIKLSEKEIETLSEKQTDHLVTDGYGNLYEIPTTGKTELFTVSDVGADMKFLYDFDKQQIDLYLEENDKHLYMGSYSVSAEDFIDGPEYWCRVANNGLLSDIKYDRAYYNATIQDSEDNKTSEAYELYGEIIDEDKSKYVYKIRIDWEFEDSDWGYKEYEDILEILSKYHKTEKLYGDELDIQADRNLETDYVYLVITFSMPLTKEELMDIFDSYEEVKTPEINEITEATIYIGDIFEED